LLHASLYSSNEDPLMLGDMLRRASTAVFLVALGCARGSDLGDVGEAGAPSGDAGAQPSDGSGAGGTTTSGPGPGVGSTSVTGGAPNAASATTDASTTATGPAPSADSSSAAMTSSTSSGGGVMCAPETPAPGCGAGMHCVPSLDVSADPTCEPAGAGGPYALCIDRSECSPERECVSDGLDACCMTWCVLGSGVGCAPSETCTELGAPLYANGQEYGVCWDGLPCVL
jgi:hypothetical protein